MSVGPDDVTRTSRTGATRWGLLAAGLLTVLLSGCSAVPVAAPAVAPTSAITAASVASPTMPARDPRCRLDDLSAQLTDPNTAVEPVEMRVIWINRSDHTCTMTGFGGVDVVDAQGRHLSFLRAQRASDPRPATVSLTPGMRAHTTIAYTSQGGTGSFRPVAVLATPPDETRSARLAWTAQGLPTFPDPTVEELALRPVSPNVS